MSATPTVLVTGGAGKTGLAVITALARAGAQVRATVRGSAQIEAVTSAGASDAHRVDLDTGAGLPGALDGVDGVYLVVPNVHPREAAVVGRIIDLAVEAGVSRLTYHSVMHPHDPAMPHHMGKADAEVVVRGAPLDWCLLQPAAYLQNHLPALLTGRLEIPYDLDRPFTHIDLADLAQVAASTLLQPGHAHATYELAGSEQLTMRSLAALAGEILHRPIALRQKAFHPSQDGDPYAQEALVAMFRAYDSTGFVGGFHVLRYLLGREPRGLRDALLDASG